MFSLAQMELQISVFRSAAERLEKDAAEARGRFADLLRGQILGFHNCADSLERMVQNEIAREAQDAMERGVA